MNTKMKVDDGGWGGEVLRDEDEGERNKCHICYHTERNG